MNPIDDWIRTGDLDGGLSALVDQVRTNPSNVQIRIRLFQAYALNGDWEGAASQLRLVRSLSRGDQDLLLGVPAYLNLIAAERLRASVFQQGTAPVFFGEPKEWMALQLESLRQIIRGEWKSAKESIERSREAAPAIPGRLDGQAFEWIMDADSRLGPLLEVVLAGRYYWMPFSCVERISLSRPTQLQDQIWMPGDFSLRNGSVLSGYVFTRYPGTERETDSNLRLARATEWRDVGDGLQVGVGLRIWSTDLRDIPVIEARQLVLDAGN